jgi:formate dehydrogenase maturation protein FdhE
VEITPTALAALAAEVVPVLVVQTQAAAAVVLAALMDQEAPALSSFVTQVLKKAQVEQSHLLAATPITPSHLLGRTQHEPVCPNRREQHCPACAGH